MKKFSKIERDDLVKVLTIVGVVTLVVVLIFAAYIFLVH